MQLVVYYLEKTPYAPVFQIAFFPIICLGDYSDISNNVSDIQVKCTIPQEASLLSHILWGNIQIYMQVILFVFFLVLFGMTFNAPVICHGQVDTVSSLNH